MKMKMNKSIFLNQMLKLENLVINRSIINGDMT